MSPPPPHHHHHHHHHHLNHSYAPVYHATEQEGPKPQCSEDIQKNEQMTYSCCFTKRVPILQSQTTVILSLNVTSSTYP